MPPAQSIRVLHVVLSLEPGGMENGIVNLARQLPPEEFKVGVCCLSVAGEFVARLPSGTEVSVLNKGPGFSSRAVLRLWQMFRQWRPQVVHTHNLGPLIYGGLASGVGRWFPLLHGEHAELPPDDLTPRRLRQRHFFYRGCRRIHTVSQSLREHLVEQGFDAAKITSIVNGVDVERFSPGDGSEVRRQWKIPAEARVIGMVGRFGPFKRHDLLLAAFEQVAAKDPLAWLLLVGGGGPEEARIRGLAQSSPHAGRIVVAGFQADPAPFYRAMNLLVVPSINEGLSNAILEAMASGVAPLCHTACGNGEVVRHGVNGFVEPLDSPDVLAGRLLELLPDSELLSGVGNRARETARESLSLKAMVDQYARLYREIAIGAGPR